MPVVSKETLKSYFNTGDVPTESNYVDLIDTLFGGVGNVPQEGPGIDIPLNTSFVGLGGDTFLVYHADKTPAGESDTCAGALALAVYGDVIFTPPGVFTENIDIPAGIGIISQGHKTQINGIWRLLGANAQVLGVTNHYTSEDSNPIKAVIGPTVSATVFLRECMIIPVNLGSGGVRALYCAEAGIVETYDCLLDGRNDGGGAGEKYAAFRTGGANIYIHGGRCLPTIDPFNE